MATMDFAGLLQAQTPVSGTNETHWPGLTLLRVTEPMPRTSVVYNPCVCFVARGNKLVHLGSETYRYDPMNYLVISLPLPVEAEIVQATPDDPLLALVEDRHRAYEALFPVTPAVISSNWTIVS